MIRIIVFFAAIGLLAACETAEGFGRDVERAGEGIQRAAN